MSSWVLLWVQFSSSLTEAAPVLRNAEVYQRAKIEFAEANFYKPLESGTNELTFSLAPLLIQEVKGPEAQVHGRDQFGTVSSSNGVVALDRVRPAVYFRVDSVEVNGRAHARFEYVWFYGVEPQPQDRGLAVQGIRLTLSTNGEPAVWEVLADTWGKELVFVSQSVEAAARAEFGVPLSGRKFAIERSLEQAPDTVVARVLEDGPMPMGPLVYLEAGTRCVSTVICRCMATQAKKLAGTGTYRLIPLSALDSRVIEAQLQKGLTNWPGDEAKDGRLARRLRLPSSF